MNEVEKKRVFDLATDIELAITTKELSFEDRMIIARTLITLGYNKKPTNYQPEWHYITDKNFNKILVDWKKLPCSKCRFMGHFTCPNGCWNVKAGYLTY